jgi:hypothetical protein
LLRLQGGLANKFKNWELLALVLAAAGHDVGHKGKAVNPAVVLTGACMEDCYTYRQAVLCSERQYDRTDVQHC